jgi:altronate dehydratase small subunit
MKGDLLYHMNNTAIVISQLDNVATALCDLKKGQSVNVAIGGEMVCITLKQDICAYHKFSLTDIPKGENIYKYGQVIGQALCDIDKGTHVHVHNLKSLRG